MSDRDLDFAAFYDEFLPQVYRYVRYRVTDVPTAEDLTATVFETALRTWKGRRNPNSTAPWIFRIARNTVISHYRRRGRRPEVPLNSVQDELSTPITPEVSVLQTERWERIQQSVQALSPREQHIIALKFGSELTNRAIAPIIGTSENNVGVILYRTMRKLRAHLEREQGSVSTPERSISYG